jgi:hypothetical protein
MQTFYKKTQTGWLIILIFLLLFLLFTGNHYFQHIFGKALEKAPALSWLFLGIGLLFLILLGMFATLTVTGFQDNLEIRFGIGPIRKRFYYKDIRSCSIQKNSIIYGWGIRAIPGGWLYNVSGIWSVQLDMKNGKMYRIGTAEPQKLEQFIKTRINLFSRH